MKKIILGMFLVLSSCFAGERSVSTIGNYVFDIDYNMTQDNRVDYIKRACKMAFKQDKNIKYCVQIISLEMTSKGGLSKQYFSKNTNIKFSVDLKENYKPFDLVHWVK